MSNEINKDADLETECTIPEPVSMKVLRATNTDLEHEKREIAGYVEWQAQKDNEKVEHLEKIKTEAGISGVMDAWDVHTDRSRYWVITNPTNLYSQDLFPGLDYTISFHVGVATRMAASRKMGSGDEPSAKLLPVLRQWQQAAEAFDLADEAEEFQAVGARCRECLTTFSRSVGDASMVQDGVAAPKAGDFVQWSEHIANTIATGASAREIRGYLKAVSKSTWELVNWLTHAKNASRFDAQIAVESTETILSVFGAALLRHDRGIPERCPDCHSYRMAATFEFELPSELPYVIICKNCGWNDFDAKMSGDVRSGLKES